MSAAPLTTEALRHRIGVPDEVRRYLRLQEAEVRRRLEELAPFGAEPDVGAVREELRAVLEDARRSPLLRALRRRTALLETGAAARASLAASMEGLFKRADRAVERVHAAAALRTKLDQLHARFAAMLPWHLARGMERMRISADEARWPRDPVSLKAAAGRVADVERDLADRASLIPAVLPDVLEIVDWPPEVALAELCGAIQEADRVARPHRELAWREQGRALGRAHVERLLGSGSSGGDSGLVVAAARQALAVVEAGGSAGAEDLDAQLIVVRDAARRRSPGHGAAAERVATAAESETATGGLLFVVPLFGDFVLIRRGEPWPVRIDAMGVTCGKPAPCSANLPPGEAVTLVAPERWAPPLFDMPEPVPGEWLETAQPASVLPFARIGEDRWIGRVRARGRLRPAGHSRWEAARPRRGTVVRALPPVSEADAEGIIQVGPVVNRQDGPFGWTTLTVQLPFADLPVGWLRTAESIAGRDHVEAEQAFFQAANRLVPGCMPRCLGRSEKPHGYVYAPPLAVSTESSLVLRMWREMEPLVFVAAVARLWKRLSDSGLALGFYHSTTIGYGINATKDAERVEARVIAAPLGIRLGHRYRRSLETRALFPGHLGTGDFAPQRAGDVALPLTEACVVRAHLATDATTTAHYPLTDPGSGITDEEFLPLSELISILRSDASV